MPKSHKTALVTGASAGIGAEFCRQLADRCDVILATGRREDRLAALVSELERRVEIRPIVADLTTEEGRICVIEAIHQYGPLQYLVNNAGFGAGGIFAETDLESQQQQVDLHVTATLALTRAALPAMIERGAGCVINVSSLASFAGSPKGMVYGASKAFLNIFSEGLQQEVAAQGIKVQSLCPGYTYSEFHDRETITRTGFSRDQIPQDAWMEACDVVASSLEALDGEQVIIVPGEHNLVAARQRLEELLKQLGG